MNHHINQIMEQNFDFYFQIAMGVFTLRRRCRVCALSFASRTFFTLLRKLPGSIEYCTTQVMLRLMGSIEVEVSIPPKYRFYLGIKYIVSSINFIKKIYFCNNSIL